jgi:hypothetical protein
VSITYQRNQTQASAIVNIDGNEVLNLIDGANQSWRNTSGTYWGIGGWNGGALMDAYIRRVELTYVPDASGQFIKGLVANSEKRYPEAALTANSSLNCVASAITEQAGNVESAWMAFDFNTNNTVWTPSAQTFSSGSYTGSTSTIIDGVGYLGDWLQIQLPNSIFLKSYKLIGRWNDIARSPKLFYIAGSTNGTTWTMLDIRSNITNWVVGLPLEFNINTRGTAYNYFRIVVNQNNGSTWLSIQQWELYGYRQFGIKYPIGPMTSDTTTFAGNALGCGTYRTTYSSTWSSNEYLGWRAFTGEANDAFHISNDGVGAGSGGGLYRGTNGTYTGTVTTTISGSSYSGEWLQIELPNPIRLTRYSLLSRISLPTQSARTWKIAGSNDASTWTEVDTQTNITGWADNVAKSFTSTNSTIAYKYYRMVTNQIQDPADWHWSQREWMLFDDTTTSSNFYGKAPGLIEGLTWKFYDVYFGTSPNSLDTLSYTNIGRSSNLTNVNTGTNGQYRVDGTDNYAIEWFGYFRANVTGTHTFYLSSDNQGYCWLGNIALSGYTNSNYSIGVSNFSTGVLSSTIFMIEGVYYPLRVRFTEAGGGDNCTFSFAPPNGTQTFDGTGYFFSSIGTNQAFPAESAKIIKEITQTNTDGVYYINVNGTSTPVHCLMNDIYDGGGWMMLMKATRGTTFNYDANYWTTTNTLNETDTTRNDADAKYNTFNYMPIKDVMAIWPDISPTAYTNVYSKNGGSLLIDDGWVWKVDNWNGSNRTTALAGFQNSRDAHPSNPYVFNGFGTSLFSHQTGSYRHILGGSTHTNAWSSARVRWGLIFNNQVSNNFDSADVISGIGLGDVYSSGDTEIGTGTRTMVLNRSARIEMYGR